jgi:pyridinium-3,5-biscarboxylic acid mononucleotide sulfurtransferase
MDITEKKRKLQEFLSTFPDIAVAYSGGIDSTLILKFAHLSNKKITAFIVKTFFTLQSDFNDAINFCNKINVNFHVIEPDDSEFEPIINNPLDRCYKCKNIILKKIMVESLKYGFNNIIDGSNISDLEDYRPGKKALKELGIISPFDICGITKDDIRAIAKELNIDFYDKPSNSCLLTRFPYGSIITKEKTMQVQKGENILHESGFNVVRLRHFENIALIEVGINEREKLFDIKLLDHIKKNIMELGFDYVALEAGGYKTGNLNTKIEREIYYG